MTAKIKPKYVSTRNACKLCAPLGACLAFRGVEGMMSLLHGSQGCSTYIRRYLIGHFREPVDIASSNFSEHSAIFGGKENLHAALRNISSQYKPNIIGVASTCLSETIGDDLKMFIGQYEKEERSKGKTHPDIVQVSTPSYSGSHIDGYHAAVRALVNQYAGSRDDIFTTDINLFPGMWSTADIRHLHEIVTLFGLRGAILPDYSDTLDGGAVDEYQPIPKGGTPLDCIRSMSTASASLVFDPTLPPKHCAGDWLKQNYNVDRIMLNPPIGIKQTDALISAFSSIFDAKTPDILKAERSRLVDSYFDAHKYIFGKRAVIYGEEDFVIGLSSFLAEIGMRPVICASGGKSGQLKTKIKSALSDDLMSDVNVLEGVDFAEIGEEAADAQPDLLIGNSKGYAVARELNAPLVRVGFPIQDRIGGQRILHIGYRGAQQLFDKIVNTIIQNKQDSSPVGYMTM